MTARYLFGLTTLVVLGLGALFVSEGDHAAADTSTSEQLQQIRNLAKAFYETPGTQEQAVTELRKAVDLNPQSVQDRLNYGLALLRAGKMDEGIAEVEAARKLDPALPHTYFNLGIEFKKRGEAERAIAELEQMVKLVPDEPKTHYNLGVLYRQQEQVDKARAAFERAAELDPSLAAPHFQLFNLLRRDDPDKAKQELARFQEIKGGQDESAAEDVNWSFYSELYDPVATVPPAPGESKPEFQSELWAQLEGKAGGLDLTDLDGDHKPEAIAWSSQSIVVAGAGGTSKVEAGLKDIRHVAAGDSNNDKFPDLCIVTGGGAQLLLANAGRVFSSPKQLAAGDFQAALWVDFDHDYDLDLLLTGAQHSLLRNNGDGSFADVSTSFPFKQGSLGLAAAWLELEEDNGFDIVIAYADGVVVYHDRKLGRYEAHPLEGAQPTARAERVRLDVADLNNDGYLDVAMTSVPASASATAILENQRGQLRAGQRLAGVAGFIDAQNRGWADAVADGKLLANRGGFQFEEGPAQGLPQAMLAAAAADFNGDGLSDLAVLETGGALRLATNRTQTKGSYSTFTLEGVKNRLLAEGSRVEVKAGRLYRKQLYRGASLTFGLGNAKTIDTVRITWPNGMIQNESRQETAKVYHYVEKPRLSGSCPMIFTWNGRGFEFISEVLGVAPLGASIGGDQFFPVDHDEYVWIDGKNLVPRNGFHEVRITEELREIAYLDHVKLFAVDHPAGVEIFTNEKFKGPPFPEFRLFGVEKRHYPARATDRHGHNVLDRVTKLDRRYADDFKRDFAARAETHSLTLDFSSLAGRDDITLFLNGWVDWADASTFVGSAQSASSGMYAPYLEVRDGQGNWVRVISDMGLPAGRPRTIAVDLKGKFLSASREVRITTNLCLYWDEAFAATGAGSPEAKQNELALRDADLQFRGFSHLDVHPERKQPEMYDYARVYPTSMWNPAPGNYTRYGNAAELLQSIDDRFVIMGSGDQLALRFSADGLPLLPRGWKRNFLLLVDGWAKESESNTAYGHSVEPLPFHGMSRYPYGPNEHYPDTALHRQYQRDYNTRPALRLIRPLAQNTTQRGRSLSE
jgi:tetratricopeptide (TPR) repeat protein